MMRDRRPERLYTLLPAHVRARDAEEGRPLEALMRLLAAELEVVEGDIDALYDDWFIETCEDWAVPYIGALVGARPLRPFGEGGGSLRAYVANTLSYRQAKGTIATVEQLARDVTGWPAHAVEFFRLLAWSQNLNRLRPENAATLSLRDSDAAARVDAPFSRAARTVGVRPVETGEGRYNIPNVGVYLWRLESWHLPFVFAPLTAGEIAPGDPPDYLGAPVPRVAAHGSAFRRFDPVGRDIPLFNRARSEPAMQHLAREVDLPGPLRRRPLHDDLNALRAGTPGAGGWFDPHPVVAIRLNGEAVPTHRLHACRLEDRDDGVGGIVWRQPSERGRVLFDPELGRLSLHPDDADLPVEATCAIAAAHRVGAGPYGRRASLAQWWPEFDGPVGDLWQIGVTPRPAEQAAAADPEGPVVASLAAAIDAWNATATTGRRGVIALMDSASHGEDLSGRPIRLPPGSRLAIVAADWPADPIGGGARTRTPGRLDPLDRRPHVASDLHVFAEPAGEGENPGLLVVDGVLLEGRVAVEATDPADPAVAGDLGILQLRHATLGAGRTGLGPGVTVTGGNARLSILLDHAVSGPLTLGRTAAVSLRDCILGEERTPTAPGDRPLVLDAPEADLEIACATLFGACRGRTLSADAVLFLGPPEIARRQQGCLRYCFVPEGARTPRRFRCVPDLQLRQLAERLDREPTPAEVAAVRARLHPRFNATVAEAPAFGQLARACPAEIAEGADDGGEIGAMNALGNPARLANLRDALDEYLPFGRLAGPFFIT